MVILLEGAPLTLQMSTETALASLGLRVRLRPFPVGLRSEIPLNLALLVVGVPCSRWIFRTLFAPTIFLLGFSLVCIYIVCVIYSFRDAWSPSTYSTVDHPPWYLRGAPRIREQWEIGWKDRIGTSGPLYAHHEDALQEREGGSESLILLPLHKQAGSRYRRLPDNMQPPVGG